MLLELAQWLAKDIRIFNVFNYITLRTVLAALTSLAISFIVGAAPLILTRRFRANPSGPCQAASERFAVKHFIPQPRIEAEDRHLSQNQTPVGL